MHRLGRKFSVIYEDNCKWQLTWKYLGPVTTGIHVTENCPRIRSQKVNAKLTFPRLYTDFIGVHQAIDIGGFDRIIKAVTSLIWALIWTI